MSFNSTSGAAVGVAAEVEVGDGVDFIGAGCVVQAPSKSRHKRVQTEKLVFFMILLRANHSSESHCESDVLSLEAISSQQQTA